MASQPHTLFHEVSHVIGDVYQVSHLDGHIERGKRHNERCGCGQGQQDHIDYHDGQSIASMTPTASLASKTDSSASSPSMKPAAAVPFWPLSFSVYSPLST